MSGNKNDNPKDNEGEDNAGTETSLYSRLISAPSNLYNWLQGTDIMTIILKLHSFVCFCQPAVVTRPIRESYEPEPVDEGPLQGSVINRKSARQSTIPLKTTLQLNSTLQLLSRTEEAHLIDELPTTIPSKERVLNKHIISILQAAMPARCRICQDWKLIYSSRRDGYSLSTLFQRNKKYHDCPCILAVKDDKGTVFGAWSTESFHVQNGHYGTGECFLWRVTRGGKGVVVEKYGATGKNPYYLMGESSYLAAGVS